MEAINFNANINKETVPELPPEQKNRNLCEDRGSSLDPYYELTHSHWVKVLLSGIGWATARYKVIRWLLSLAHGRPARVTTYFCVDKFSELQYLLLVNSVWQLHRIWRDVQEFTFSWNL